MQLIFWILSFAYFFLAVFIAFYIPGTVVLKKLKLPFFENSVLSVVLGMVMLAWQGMIFGYVHLRQLTYIYLLVFLGFWIRNLLEKKIKFSPPKVNKYSIVLIVIILIGVVVQLTTTWFAGIQTNNGIYYCCGDTRDNIIAIAYVDQIVKHFPPVEPGLPGAVIRNYHYWGHIVVAELIRVFNLPLISTVMQFVPFLLCLLLGLLSIVFTRLLKLKHSFALWLLFFLYFGGDLVYLLSFIFGKGLSLQSSPIETGVHFLVNYPTAFSVIIFLAGLNLFVIWNQKRKTYLAFLAAFVLGSVIGFKVNLTLFALGGLATTMIYLFLKKNYQLFIPSIFALLLSLVIYLPVNFGAGGFIFVGFWKAQDFVVQPIFNLSRLELAREVYIAHKSWLRVLEYDLFFALLFVIGTFGTKIIGLIQSRKSLGLIPREINIFLISGIVFSSIVGFFFLQNPGGANSVFFLIAIYIVGSIYTALACSYWIKNIKLPHYLLLALIIVVLTIPKSTAEIISNIHALEFHNPGISIDEVKALSYLKNYTVEKSMILADPSYYLNHESPYVNLYSNRNTFLSGQGDELEAHSIDFSKQEQSVKIIFNSQDPEKINAELKKDKINYLYLPNGVATESGILKIKTINQVFSSGTVKILKVN